jgi:hypothetical protein
MNSEGEVFRDAILLGAVVEEDGENFMVFVITLGGPCSDI